METLLNAALQRVKQAEVYWIEEESLPVSFNNGQINRINGKKVQGISLRVIDENGRLGYATATRLDRDDLIERAILSASYGDKTQVTFPGEVGKAVSCYDPVVANLTSKEMIEQGQQMLTTMAALDPSMQVDMSITREVNRVKIMNSSGLNASYDKTNFEIGLMSRGADGFREVNDIDSYARYFTFDEARLARFVENHQLSRERFKVKTGKMDILFNPGAMWALLYRVFAGVNGSAINRGISPLKDRLGEELFNPLVNIVDDPTYAWGLATQPYDDEGSVASRTPVVEQGILKNYLFDLDAAVQYGTSSTGNGIKKNLFAAGIDQKPETYPTNLMLLPGESSYAEMVADMKYGLIVNSIMGGHTGNIQAGEFGLNIGSGFLVENGVIKGKVVDAMVSGNIYDLFKRVRMIGNNLQTTHAIFYGLGYSPSILVPELTVAGSEA